MHPVPLVWAVFHHTPVANHIVHCDLLEDHILPYTFLLEYNVIMQMGPAGVEFLVRKKI